MDDWLDNETKARLRKHPPKVQTAAGEESYALVVLIRGADDARIDEAISAVAGERGASRSDLPFVVARGLSLEEAYVGQFALACCDCAVSFVPDAMGEQADRTWWRQYYRQVMQSSDFQQEVVELLQIPPGEAGRQYAWQFLGLATVSLPRVLTVFRIKAELMEYWGNKLGAEVRRRGQTPAGAGP